MSAEELEKYETEMELTLYREYRDVVSIFKYVVETDRRFYLCNQVDVKARTEAGDVFFECRLPTPGCGTCTARPDSPRT